MCVSSGNRDGKVGKTRQKMHGMVKDKIKYERQSKAT